MEDKVTQKKIEKTFIIIDGKKVPLYKIPPGMSGLGVDVQRDERIIELSEEDQDLEDEKRSSIELSDTFKENPEFEQSVNKYFDDGEFSHDLDEYISNKMSSTKDLVDLFRDGY